MSSLGHVWLDAGKHFTGGVAAAGPEAMRGAGRQPTSAARGAEGGNRGWRRGRIELTNKGFADLCLTTWLPRPDHRFYHSRGARWGARQLSERYNSDLLSFLLAEGLPLCPAWTPPLPTACEILPSSSSSLPLP